MHSLLMTNLLLSIIVLCVIVLTVVTTVLLIHLIHTTKKVKHIVGMFDRDLTKARGALIEFKDAIISRVVTPKK